MTSRSPATTPGQRRDSDRGGPGRQAGGLRTGSRSSPPCCWRWPLSPPRGAATRPTGGTGRTSRPSSRVNALRIDAAHAQGLAEGQTQVDVAVHPAGERRRQRRSRPPTSTRPGSDRSSAPRSTPGWRRNRCRRPTPTDAVRDGRIPVAARPMRSGSTQEEAMAAVVRRNVHAPPTTCSPWCCSPCRCSSPHQRQAARAGTKALLTVGCVMFLGTAIWIATFPVSLSGLTSGQPTSEDDPRAVSSARLPQRGWRGRWSRRGRLSPPW